MKANPRVLHLVHTPGPGGTEAVVGNLLTWIAPSDATQAVACPAGPLAETARRAGRPWYPVAFGTLRRPAAGAGLIRALAAAPAVMRELAVAFRSFQPDIVHAHGAKAAVLAAAWRRRSRPWMLVWHLHDYLPLGPLRRLWIHRARRAEGIVAVSRHVAETVLGDASCATVIPNAIAPPPPSDPAEGDRLLSSIGVPAGSVVIGYAGRLDREKGVETLLHSFVRIAEKEASARLLIAGSSPFKPKQTRAGLARLSADLGVAGRVHFAGRLPDLAGFYSAITLFVLPSPCEPFGLVILEALVRGIPVVAFAAGGAREILEPFDPSMLVPPADCEAFAATCCRILRDGAGRERVRRAGPEFVARAFAPDVQCGALVSLYRSLAA